MYASVKTHNEAWPARVIAASRAVSHERTASRVGRTASRVGRTVSRVGRTVPRVGRTVPRVGRTVPRVGRQDCLVRVGRGLRCNAGRF